MSRAPRWSPSGFPAPRHQSVVPGDSHSHFAASRLFPGLLMHPLLSTANAHARWKVLLGGHCDAEVLWALPVLYTFRELERRMGSNKFASFALSTATVLATQIGLMHIFTGGDRYLASGPYGLIFGLYTFFFATIPKLSPQSLSLFGVHFSDKSFTYIMGAQLAMNGWNRGNLFGSLVSASAGLAFGLLYISEIFPLHHLRLPSSLGSFLGKTVLPWFGSSSPWESRIRTEQARQERQRQAQQRRNQGGMTPAHLMQYQQQVQAARQASMQGQMPVVEPSQENVAQIVAMGFSEERAVEALQYADNVRPR